MKKADRYIMRQTSPVITVARLASPYCIITFDITGQLQALSYTGTIEDSQEYIIVAEAWRFVQKNTQAGINPNERRRVKRRNSAKADII
jgi:hypothetical protein